MHSATTDDADASANYLIQQPPRIYILYNDDKVVGMGFTRSRAAGDAKRRGYDGKRSKLVSVPLDWAAANRKGRTFSVAGYRVQRHSADSSDFHSTCGRCQCTSFCGEITQVFGSCRGKSRYFLIVG